MVDFASNLLGLPPWDMLPYFDIPIETTLTNLNSGQQLVKADNRRVMLIFSGNGQSLNLSLSTKPTATSSQGFGISSAVNPFILTTWEHGPLPCLAWYNTISLLGGMTILEVTANDWPVAGQPDHLSAIAHPPPVMTPPQITKAPGVNGGQGVIDYWRNLIAKIKG